MRWLASLSLAALAASLSWWITDSQAQIALARLTHEHQQQMLHTLEQDVQALERARRLGDDLTNALAAKSQQIQKLQKEKRDALSQVTHGAACLDGDALRVLKQSPGISVAADMPGTTSGAAAADGAAATDTDVALWIVDAGAQYEQCRARLGALIDWHTKKENDAN